MTINNAKNKGDILKVLSLDLVYIMLNLIIMSPYVVMDGIITI
jgi:hypothetical protein